MQKRKIAISDVHHVLQTGVVIEDYPDDTPYPSYLMLGWKQLRPIHVVAADNQQELKTIIITVYEPDPERWDSSFSRRLSS
jgi:hypothetical protein